MSTMKKIKVYIGDEEFDARLDEAAAPVTVRKIYDALPIDGTINSWGDEFYFPIPVEAENENSVESVSKGDLAFWPRGNAFCIFFGKTPVSTSDEKIIPASPVNPIGHIEDAKRLKHHGNGETVRIVPV